MFYALTSPQSGLFDPKKYHFTRTYPPKEVNLTREMVFSQFPKMVFTD